MQKHENISRWKFYNPNPKRKRVGDCTVRAIAKALGQNWEKTFAGLTAYGYEMCDMPSANNVWGKYLKMNGYCRYMVDDHGQDFYSVEDFCRDNPIGTYILALDNHVVCIVDGYYYDSWDSGQEEPIYYWAKGE